MIKKRLLFIFLFNALLVISFFKLVNSQPLPPDTSETDPVVETNPGGDFLVVVATSHTIVDVGQAISVTATLYNNTTDTCLGIPKFNLTVNGNPVNPSVFEPVNDMSPTYTVTLLPGDRLETTFSSTATSPGTATFFVSADGEASPWSGAGCPGPFYWEAASGLSGEVFVIENAMTSFIPSLFRPYSQTYENFP